VAGRGYDAAGLHGIPERVRPPARGGDVRGPAGPRAGGVPRALGLEITESVLIENSDSPIAILETLRSLGPRLILDDFGTGYSSLSYLQRLPLDQLKLDRSFVAGLAQPGRDRDIVSALIHLARVLDLDVVVEGVETAAQLACLKEMECLFAQGYFLARPMPARDFERMLAVPDKRRRPAGVAVTAAPACH
jgi:EAL domain-containing protein (putative c-di-GMP-specific phosphodiesterase class I)